MTRRFQGLLVAALCAIGSPLHAQTSQRFELSAGGLWFGATQYPAVDATERSPGGGTRVVFQSRSTLDSSLGVGVRLGMRITPGIAVESTVSLNRTHLRTLVSGDVEGVADATASEPVTQYLFEGGVLWGVPRWTSSRLAPFATAGVGYLRQLNDGQTLVQTGRSFYLGGGAHYRLKDSGRGWIKSAGLRFDARASVLERGVALDQGRHLVPTLGAAAFLRF